MATAVWVAVMINAGVALAGLVLAAVSGNRVAQPSSAAGSSGVSPQVPTAGGTLAELAGETPALQRSWPVYLTIALSGMCALAAEVIWTRLLSLMLGGTVYAFSIILAVFLVGLGVGSGCGAFLARGSLRPRLALGVCQVLLAGAVGMGGVRVG